MEQERKKNLSDFRHKLTHEEGKKYTSPAFLGKFPLGEVSIVASKPGVGKTWYMLYNILYHSRQYSVGALVGDCSPNMIYDRVNLLNICQDINHDNIYMYFLDEILREYNQFDISGKSIGTVENAIKGGNLKMFYIDTLASMSTADESSQKEIAPLMQKLVGIARNYNCAIIVNHHIRKSQSGGKNENDIDDVIGSSILTRLAGLVLMLIRRDNEINVKCVKSWYKEPQNNIFRMTKMNDGKLIVSEGYDFGVSGQKRALILEFVAHQPKGQILIFEDLKNLLPDIGDRTIYTVYHDLIEKGLVKDENPNLPIMSKKLVRI